VRKGHAPLPDSKKEEEHGYCQCIRVQAVKRRIQEEKTVVHKEKAVQGRRGRREDPGRSYGGGEEKMVGRSGGNAV